MNINITDKAKEMIKKTLDDKKIENPVIRVYIAGMGWGGPSFGIALDEQKQNDQSVENDGVNYVVEDDLINRYGGFDIDYSNNWLSKGFRVSPSRGGSSC